MPSRKICKPFKVRHAAALDKGYHVTLQDGQWTRHIADDVQAVAELLKAGKSERDIAKELEMTPSKVHRLAVKAKRSSREKLNLLRSGKPQTAVSAVLLPEAAKAAVKQSVCN